MPIYKLNCNHGKSAIISRSYYSARFGGGHYLHIANNANANENSYSYSTRCKNSPQDSASFLAGSRNFRITEIEVYHLI